MGGNIFLDTIRLGKYQYQEISNEVLTKLRLNNLHGRTIPAISGKDDFGDCDIIIGHNDYQKAALLLPTIFDGCEISRNKNVISILYKQFQIDLIFIPIMYLEYCYAYLAFNDLGNLAGRIAHNLGFKHGQYGLTYVMREPNNNNNVIDEIIVTLDVFEAMYFLGFNSHLFHKAIKPVSKNHEQQIFVNITDVFKFVIHNPYFKKDFYPLEHRNHIARMRDRKRKTYMQFLRFIQEINIPWEQPTIPSKDVMLYKAFQMFPDFEKRYNKSIEKFNRVKKIKQLYNGHLVSEITGLKHKELGRFMAYLNQHHIYPLVNNSNSNSNSENDNKDHFTIIKHFYHTYCEENFNDKI
ncbi:MAG: hypothetical protein KDH96_06380 [Candidatus Riesia sp.]|nr:hypothetical protein [Candidatus Riesia sp.]